MDELEKRVKNELEERVDEFFGEQVQNWKLAETNYAALGSVQTRWFETKHSQIVLQFNPERIRSSAARTDEAWLQERPCIFCNRPEEQLTEEYDQDAFEILLNPYPIFPVHLVLPLLWHERQNIRPYFEDMLNFARDLSDFVIFYNGPKCGASAPDHMHLQAGQKGQLPIEHLPENHPKQMIFQENEITMYALCNCPSPAFVIISRDDQKVAKAFDQLYASLDIKEGDYEPMMNVLVWMDGEYWVTFVYPRKALRPSCFYAEGDARFLVSPAAVEMAGLFVFPREEDFQKVTLADIETIQKEVSYTDEEMDVVICEVKRKLRSTDADA